MASLSYCFFYLAANSGKWLKPTTISAHKSRRDLITLDNCMALLLEGAIVSKCVHLTGQCRRQRPDSKVFSPPGVTTCYPSSYKRMQTPDVSLH